MSGIVNNWGVADQSGPGGVTSVSPARWPTDDWQAVGARLDTRSRSMQTGSVRRSLRRGGAVSGAALFFALAAGGLSLASAPTTPADGGLVPPVTTGTVSGTVNTVNGLVPTPTPAPQPEAGTGQSTGDGDPVPGIVKTVTDTVNSTVKTATDTVDGV